MLLSPFSVRIKFSDTGLHLMRQTKFHTHINNRKIYLSVCSSTVPWCLLAKVPPAIWRRDMFFVCASMKTISYFQVAVWKQVVPGNRHHDHVTKIFVCDGPLVQCFPPCTTGQREREFRKYATMHLRSGCCVMAVDGSTVVGACLNRPLTRDEVMLNSVPPSVGPGMN